MVTDPSLLSLIEASARIADGRLTSRALVSACLDRIARLDPVLSTWVALDAGRALTLAAEADAAISAGRRRGPLHGIPYGVKDILFTADFPTRAASRLPFAVPEEAEAMVIQRLREAGAILLGKLNTYEFGTGNGAVYDDLPVPPARNPWNPDHFTGGSSTGPGAAVAARMVPFALGTDTGGSVRLPAAACGVVGLKPTYGLVPRSGMLLNCPSQDHIGPFARTAADAALVLDAIVGADPLDPASVRHPLSPPRGAGLDGLAVAVVRGFHTGDPQATPEIAAGFERVIELLSAGGARVVERETKIGTHDFRACSRVINAAESAAIHRHWLDTPGARIGSALRDKLEGAFGLPASAYLDAVRWRRVLAGDIDRLFGDCDVLLCAGTMTAAPRIDDEQGCIDFTGNSAMAAFNLSGSPAISVPCGFDGQGLPLNVQFAARAFDEAALFRVTFGLEAALQVHDRCPPDPTGTAADYAAPPSPPSREGRAAMLVERLRNTAARIPRPLPDALEPAHVFLADERMIQIREPS
ncbi:MAG: amidase [Alphaproteobacteria bacterium]|nr:amidase [Alphaproteobacteria bacterium]